MNKMRPILMTIGMLLIMGLLLFPIVAGEITYNLPRFYYSQSKFEIKNGMPNRPYLPASPEVGSQIEAVLAQFGTLGKYRLVQNTDLYEIGVWDKDPGTAARNANAAAYLLQEHSNIGNSGMSVKIWENAEPALLPGYPKVLLMLLAGLAAGILSALAGVGVLLFARGHRETPPDEGAQLA